MNWIKFGEWKAVNLDQVVRFEKSFDCQRKHHCIEFFDVSGCRFIWVYPNKLDRDDDYQAILHPVGK